MRARILIREERIIVVGILALSTWLTATMVHSSDVRKGSIGALELNGVRHVADAGIPEQFFNVIGGYRRGRKIKRWDDFGISRVRS